MKTLTLQVKNCVHCEGTHDVRFNLKSADAHPEAPAGFQGEYVGRCPVTGETIRMHFEGMPNTDDPRRQKPKRPGEQKPL